MTKSNKMKLSDLKELVNQLSDSIILEQYIGGDCEVEINVCCENCSCPITIDNLINFNMSFDFGLMGNKKRIKISL